MALLASPIVVDLWWLDLAAAPPTADCRLDVLDAAERARLAGYRDAAAGRRFALARIALRVLLAARDGAPDASPADVALAAEAHGRPIRGHGLGGPSVDRESFNVSHAGTHAVIAFCRTHAVGVDVEHARAPSAEDRRTLWPTTCSAAERALLGAMAPGDADRAFARLWTRKEALAKAAGTGLRIPFTGIDLATAIDRVDGRVQLRWPAAPGGCAALWQAVRVPGADDAAAAVAVVLGAGDEEGAPPGICIEERAFDPRRWHEVRSAT